VLKRSFGVGLSDKAWAGDITYLHTKRGWAYLAALLDLGTRKVLGWKVVPHSIKV
jgi:transposase InsO family protein